jgi:DnaJ-class molecular chaperone
MAKGFLDGYQTYDTSKGFGNAKKWRKALYEKMSREDANAIIEKHAETPYEILSVSAQASEAEIKKAFRKLIVLWHPDKNPEQQDKAEEMSKKIIAAYTILIG